MDFGQQYLAVAGVLGLLGSLLWWLRRRGYASARVARRPRRLESVERLALSPQLTLHLVRVGDAEVLLACSPSVCAVVRDLGSARQGEGEG